MKIREKLSAICGFGSRAPGSRAELKAAEYIRATLKKIGLEVVLEPFESPSHLAISSELKTVKGKKTFVSVPAQFSAEGQVKGELLYIGTCDNSLVDGADIRGKIGLLLPTSSSHKERIDFILNLEQCGLAGLIAICPAMELINAKIVRYPEIKKMPVAVVSWGTALELYKLEKEMVALKVKHEKNKRNGSQNVVARVRGNGRYWLAVSAHYDSAAFSPGAADNAGGTAVLMELAEIFAAKKLPATVYFLFTGSEEYGALDSIGAGARAFYKKYESEIENCIGYIDIDDIGNSLGVLRFYVGGNKRFKNIVAQLPTELKYKMVDQHKTAGDHGAAVQMSVPYIWLVDKFDAQPTFHTSEDKISNINIKRIEEYVRFVDDLIGKLSAEKPFYPYIKEDDKLIRPAHFNDIPAILDITRLAFEPVSMDKMRQDFFGEKLGGKEWHEYKNGALEAWLKFNIYNAIVCEINGKVVGYATCDYDWTRGIAAIGNNAVRPDYQGRGIGKALQREIRRRMEEDGFKKFAVATLSNDIAAQKIYEKLGYKKYIESYHYLKIRD